MSSKLLRIVIAIYYTKGCCESVNLTSRRPKNETIEANVLISTPQSIHNIDTDGKLVKKTEQYNLCDLRIETDLINGTNSTIFVGNGTDATSMNVQKLRQDLFKALQPYTGIPVLLVRVTIITNDTGKRLVAFDVYPTNNGSLINTEITKNAVHEFCYPKPTTSDHQPTFKTLFNNATVIIQTLQNYQNESETTSATLGLAVGLPTCLLGLLAVLVLILIKRKCSRRNKIMNQEKESLSEQKEDNNLYKSVL